MTKRGMSERLVEAGSAHGDTDRNQHREGDDEHHPSVVLDKGTHTNFSKKTPHLGSYSET